MICINIAENQNAVNATRVKAEGLEDKITIPGTRSYFDTGLPEESAELVITQDAVVNAGSEQPRVFREASRLLKPGGLFVMADVMQSEEAKAEDMQEASAKSDGDLPSLPASFLLDRQIKRRVLPPLNARVRSWTPSDRKRSVAFDKLKILLRCSSSLLLSL